MGNLNKKVDLSWLLPAVGRRPGGGDAFNWLIDLMIVATRSATGRWVVFEDARGSGLRKAEGGMHFAFPPYIKKIEAASL